MKKNREKIILYFSIIIFILGFILSIYLLFYFNFIVSVFCAQSSIVMIREINYLQPLCNDKKNKHCKEANFSSEEYDTFFYLDTVVTACFISSSTYFYGIFSTIWTVCFVKSLLDHVVIDYIRITNKKNRMEEKV